MSVEEKSLFLRPGWVITFACTAAIVWGLAYPLIKLGMVEFGITADMTASKLLFAGIRFLVAGLIVLAIAKSQKRSFAVRRRGDWAFLLLFSLMNTTLHYSFFYFGLSHSPGARAAIINSMSVFLVVVLACAFFRSDRMTGRKILGCAAGIAGMLALNVGEELNGQFTWLGDGMIILNAISSAVASLMTRGVVRRVDVFVGTGYSLSVGGALIMIPGLLCGGTLPHITWVGLLMLLGLVLISAIGFMLYNQLISLHPVGKIAIYNSLVPVVGVVSSCLCLHEPFYWNYLAAGLLVALGIYCVKKAK
ncbi:MAG: DMT family transporter [Bacteroidaceae bacterium]|nr:DMT family transporter [Bacteroidaceae bacterium]